MWRWLPRPRLGPRPRPEVNGVLGFMVGMVQVYIRYTVQEGWDSSLVELMTVRMTKEKKDQKGRSVEGEETV